MSGAHSERPRVRLRWLDPGSPLTARLRAIVLLVLVGACFVLGGGSRNDITSLVLLQPLAVVAGMFFLMTGPLDLAPVRTPLLLLAALAGLMAVQLIPLPPALWTALPGREPYVGIAALAGMAQPWRPISLSPDLTLASLVGLVVPAAVLLGYAAVDRERRPVLVTLLLALALASAVLGLAQIAGGQHSLFYLYAITNDDSPVGLFANRNHQAMFMSCAFPLLAVWAMLPTEDRKWRRVRGWLALAVAAFLVPVIMLTGSRAGLLLGLLGIAVAAAIVLPSLRAVPTRGGKLPKWAIIALGGAGFAALLTAVILARTAAIERLTAQSVAEDSRFSFWPEIVRIAGDFFPVGSGFGTFDPVYRSYETFEMLQPAYLNHAHNEPLEIALTGGLPALLIMALFLAWLVRQSLRAFRASPEWLATAFGRMASGAAIILLLGSLVEFPLRVPSLMTLLALSCGWLGSVGDARAGRVAMGPFSGKALYGRRVSQ